MTRSGRWTHAPFRYERVRGAGHWIPLDQPDWVAEHVLDWCGSAG